MNLHDGQQLLDHPLVLGVQYRPQKALAEEGARWLAWVYPGGDEDDGLLVH